MGPEADYGMYTTFILMPAALCVWAFMVWAILSGFYGVDPRQVIKNGLDLPEAVLFGALGYGAAEIIGSVAGRFF